MLKLAFEHFLDKGKEIINEEQLLECNSMDRGMEALPKHNGSSSHDVHSSQMHPAFESGCPIGSPNNPTSHSGIRSGRSYDRGRELCLCLPINLICTSSPQ